tara:strand:- start:3013 stop:4386 length:1374 start_codon:yes stop_codon:yes gene_type:complete
MNKKSESIKRPAMNNNAVLNVIKPSLVIVGNGMATGRLLDEITKRSPNKFNITVIGKEPYGSYNRIMLSAVLAGDTTLDAIMQKPPQWYAKNHITLMSGSTVTKINKNACIIKLASGEQLQYKQLILATGSRTAKIPTKNQDISGVFNFRDIDDTKKIQAFASAKPLSEQTNKGVKQAIVIGGGLLGLEAAYGLALSGVDVTLIHRNQWLMNRQLDKISGDMLQSIMVQKNIKFVLGHEVANFEDNGAADKMLTGARLTNGQVIRAQIAVIATGITPNKELAQTANLDVNRAILVNDYMQTSDPAISALGECCEHENATFGLVDPIWAQCITLAERICHNNKVAFKNAPVPTKLKVSGVQLFSAGLVESSDKTTSFTLLDKKSLIYRKIITKNDKIVGIVLLGDVSSGMRYFEMMQQQISVNHMMPALLISDEYFVDEPVLVNKEANNNIPLNLFTV